MAYAALISLANTIHRILNHDMFSISLLEKQQILSLLNHVNSFQGSLEEFPDKFNSLEGRMRELADEAEDILEYLVLQKVSSSSDDQHQLQLESVMGKIGLIAGEVEKIKSSSSSKGVQQGASRFWARGWVKQLKFKINCTKRYFCRKNLGLKPTIALECVRPFIQGPVDSSAPSSLSNASASVPPIRRDAMVGFEDYVKKRLFAKQLRTQVVPICGRSGIGKTTLAKNVYDDPLIMETFEIRVWITVSQEYSAEGIFSSLLQSLKEFDKGRLGRTKFGKGRLGETDEEKVYKILKDRKYLVVMDDIWSTEAWDVVSSVFLDNWKGSRVLLTTRFSDVASYPNGSSKLYELHLMDGDQSWTLFKHKVFGEEDCPSDLENIGKEITRSCQGLPLAILAIAGVVSTVDRNLASWKEIADNVRSAEQNQIEEILSLSYFHLPQYLRPCFLYMGSFTKDEEINVTKLIRLWVAEGFLNSPEDSATYEKLAEECLDELVKRNLVLVTKRKCDGRIKSCGLHDIMRDFCIRRAIESKFFLNLMDKDIEKESFIDSIKNQRRLSADSSNIRHLSSACGSTIHSIKCSRYGKVKLDFVESVRLLRVLDAEASDMEYSPLMEQVDGLFHLRYLYIRYSPSIPKRLHNLQNLQTLIIHREKETTFGVGQATQLCLEWCMPHLRHVYFHGLILFSDLEEATYSFGSLQTVSYVSHRSCTEWILKKIPNIKKFKVDCSEGPHRGEAACLNDLVHLQQLESLEVYAGCWVQTRPEYYNLSFPKMLKKLMLRDLVLPWNDIVAIGSLPYLQVFKLSGCTCVDGTWETTEGEFPQLEFLLLEYCNFENWITKGCHFPRLKRLLLRSCWYLNEIPKDIENITTLEVIEVTGRVKDSLVMSAEGMNKKIMETTSFKLSVVD